MTKDQLQKELIEKIKPGVKASDLRKLKKSKSDSDLPNTPKTQPLQHSKSQLEIPLTQPSKEETIINLKEQVKFHAETAQNYLQSLSTSQAKVSELEEKIKNNPPNPLLQEQLKVKQQEIESLRKKLEETNTKLTEIKKLYSQTTQELDNSLFARVEAVKQFGKVYDKLQLVKQELDDTVDQASDELISSDDKASSLRTKLFTARQQISDLQKDLKLAQRLAELRKDYLPDNSPNLDYLPYGIYALGTIILISWLLHSKPTQ